MKFSTPVLILCLNYYLNYVQGVNIGCFFAILLLYFFCNMSDVRETANRSFTDITHISEKKIQILLAAKEGAISLHIVH